jgi:hypothetical protein
MPSINLVLAALCDAGFTIDEKKCHFGYGEIKAAFWATRLGFWILEGEKVAAIKTLTFQRPSTRPSKYSGHSITIGVSSRILPPLLNL